MRDKILEFLKSLEAAIPPAPGCHHAVTFGQYGSDTDGWRDELTLRLSFADGKLRCFFLEHGDLEGRAGDLVSEIVANLTEAPDGR